MKSTTRHPQATDLNVLPCINDWATRHGSPSPLGATWYASHNAYNFSLYSTHALSVTLLCYRQSDPLHPVLEFRLDPHVHKTGRIWHCWIPAAKLAGATLYAFRVDGPFDPANGHRFDPEKILLDPHAIAVHFPPAFDRQAAQRPGPNDGRAPLGVLPRQEHDTFDWGTVSPPRHTSKAIIYELHVKGFTAHPNSAVTPDRRGTFAGLLEKIPYLQQLGVTIVELLPIQQFDPQEGNYWGYMTINFFAPHAQYASGNPINEFRELVKTFHAAGIEVWLDVVYNHTGESGLDGPTYSFRGIDNHSYYLLSPDNSTYLDDAGCGNVLRTGHPASRMLILESLRYWANDMHVDGFRFDLASILSRNADGSINSIDPPLLSEISLLGHYGDLSLTAEAWDINVCQLGTAFPAMTWRQWNGKFRDDIRSFVRGEPAKVTSLMQRLYGSDDLFPDCTFNTYRPFQSVNFITAHDGFCLYDLVSYNHKHNLANGHANTDGLSDNLSWNCGHEGDLDPSPQVLQLRRQQIKNFFAILLLSNGTPMFYAGDEFMNSQHGNNNPYNQDNEISWLDWSLLQKNQQMFRFVRMFIAFRKDHPSICRSSYWRQDVHWYGAEGNVDMSDESRHLAYCLLGASQDDDDLYVMINSKWESQDFIIQEGSARAWKRVIDTARPSPNDILDPGQEKRLTSSRLTLAPRSLVVLLRKKT